MTSSTGSNRPLPVVGLVPAAGQATRLGPLPCSKEIYPIGWDGAEGEPPRAKVASHYLFDNLRRAGVNTVYVVLRNGKWDIPAYWGDGHRAGLHVAYLMMRSPYGTPFTLDQAHPFVGDHRVALGFPDILVSPDDTYVHLLRRQEETDADVVLGLFPARTPEKVDMVELDEAGRPRRIVIKPKDSTVTYTWLCAVWTPTFTLYLHETIAEAEQSWRAGTDELFVGHVLQRAIDDGLSIDAVCFPDGQYTDIGTPDDLMRVTSRPVTS